VNENCRTVPVQSVFLAQKKTSVLCLNEWVYGQCLAYGAKIQNMEMTIQIYQRKK